MGGALLLVTADGRPFYVSSYPATAEGVLDGLKTHCPVGHTAVLIRRAILEEVGGYRSDIPAAEDYDLWLRVSERYPIVNLPDIVGRYRMHGGNGSRAIRAGAESIAKAQADAAGRKGESQQIEPAKLAEAELMLSLWWAEVSARAGAGWRGREKEAWRSARTAARRTADPAASAARIRHLRARLDSQLGRRPVLLRPRLPRGVKSPRDSLRR